MTNPHQIFNLSTCFLIASSSRGKGHNLIADDYGEGNGNPLQHFCLENSMDRGAWQAIGHRAMTSTFTFRPCLISRTFVGLQSPGANASSGKKEPDRKLDWRFTLIPRANSTPDWPPTSTHDYWKNHSFD